MKTNAPVCAYCRAPAPGTRDHIPPVSFFPPPRPSNLITVPCCEFCRVSQSLDDEYFRFAVVSASDTERPIAKEVFESVRRSLRKLQKYKFAQMVNESLMTTEVRSKAGLYLGRVGGLRIDKKRMDRVAQRIIRGLFFHERGYPVPETYEVANRFRQGGFEEVAEEFSKQNLKFPPWKTFGHDVFQYTYLPTQEDPDSIAWLQLYFGSLAFMGFTSRPEAERNAA